MGTMGWIITRDYGTKKDEPHYAVGKGAKVEGQSDFLDGDVFHARLRDDDGEVYYAVQFDRQAWEAPEGFPGSTYDCYLWGAGFAGSSDFEVRADDATTLGVVGKNHPTTGWVAVY